MLDLLDQQRRLEKSIKIGIVVIGSIGRGMVLQSNMTPGIDCIAITDINVNKAVDVAKTFKIDYRVVESLSELNDAIYHEKLAICGDGNLIARSELLDVFVEASSSIGGGGVR